MTTEPNTSGPAANPGQREVGTVGARYIFTSKTAPLWNHTGRLEWVSVNKGGKATGGSVNTSGEERGRRGTKGWLGCAAFTRKVPCHQLTDRNYQLIKPRSGAERNHPEMVYVGHRRWSQHKQRTIPWEVSRERNWDVLPRHPGQGNTLWSRNQQAQYLHFKSRIYTLGA